MPDSDWKSTLISKSTDVFYIIVTILGIAIILVAILGGVAYKNAIPPLDVVTRCVLGAFGLMAVALGIYLMNRSPNTALP
jgi:hypothetical protein